MEIKEAIQILDDVIPPPNHFTVDLDHLRISQAWEVVKIELKKDGLKDATRILAKSDWIKEEER